MVTRIKTALTVLLVLMLVTACGSTSTPTPTPKKQVSIEGLGWVIRNNDPSRSSVGATAFLSTSVKFADTGLEAGDFERVRVTSPTGVIWTDDEAAEFEEWFDSEEDFFYIGNLYSSDMDGASYVELGNYTVEVTLKNGNSAKETLFVPAPGSLDTDGYDFAYTENYSGAANPPSNFVALPQRAIIESAALNLGTSRLDVSFSAEGEGVYSGWLSLYDAEGTYIGYSDSFRDYQTGALTSGLTGTLFTDGAMNTFSATAEGLEFFDAASLADVASVSVVLTDGEQYVGAEGSYDVTSITAKVDVAVSR